MRHISAEGLKKRYKKDNDFALHMRHLSALAFVPVDDVVRAFETLCDANIIPPEATDILDYFEDTWVGRPHRRSRRPPKFPIKMWNCSRVAAKSMPKTNNAVEGWHTGFEATLDAVHPNIFKLLEALLREQSLVEASLEFVISGQPLAKRKKKYLDCASRIQRLVTNFASTTTEGNDSDVDDEYANPFINFLKGIAYNTALH
jgi:hypothetical protein